MNNKATLKILITGSNGFIGRNLLEKLLKKYPTLKLTLFYHKNKFPYVNQPNINQVHCDIRLIENVKNFFDSFDCVVHFAALNDNNFSIKNPLKTFNTNLLGTLNILECSRLFKIKRILLASSASVYPNKIGKEQVEDTINNTTTPYILTKKGVENWAECYANNYALPVVILRIFNTYGPNQLSKAIIPTLIFQALTKGSVHPEIGNIKKDFCYIDDLISAIELLMFSPLKSNFSCYNIGHGKSFSLLELIELIEKNLCTQLLTDKQRIDYSTNIVELSKADISEIYNDFFWKPDVNPKEGMDLSIKWYQKNLPRLGNIFS